MRPTAKGERRAPRRDTLEAARKYPYDKIRGCPPVP
jgi:hypothetical protein